MDGDGGHRYPGPHSENRDLTAETRRSFQPTFEALLESAPDAILIVDVDGKIRIVNGQAERLFGYSRRELIDRPVELLVPDKERRVHEAHRTQYATAPRARPMGAGLDLSARRKDGSEFPVEISLSPLRGDEGLLIIGVIRDVTERRRLEAAARRAHVVRAQEQERLRIARDLHDEVSQAITGITLGLGRIEAAGDLDPAREEAERLREEVAEAMRELRRITMHLRPDALDQLHLAAALEQLVRHDQAAEPTTNIVFRCRSDVDRLGPEVELVVYRVVQEALANALEHAAAETIEVELDKEDSRLVARVRDDGRGFDPEAASLQGLGLDGMRERADLIDSELAIDSAPGVGTEVVLRLPTGAT